MKGKIFFILLIVVAQLLSCREIFAQKWEFVKEKDGIKIYTSKDKNSPLKSFKGETILNTQMEKVTNMVGNVKNVEWWDKSVREIKVLSYEEGKNIKYYLVYDVPWPFTDRDLCVESKITDDPVTGQRTIYSVPLPDVVPEKPDVIRIKNYWQRWIIQPLDKNRIHVILEGHVDPAGSVPAWLYNMVITDTPLKVIRGIKSRVEPAAAK
ncbi:MAG: START domain-containing protein [bacterium]